MKNSSDSNFSENNSNNKNNPSEHEKIVDILFVYGSLNNDHHFQLITGRILDSEQAILLNHRKIIPKRGFPFVVPWDGSKVEGRLFYNISKEILTKLDDYEAEGELFTRKIAKVQTTEGIQSAYVYVGKPKALAPYIKKGYRNKDRVEEFVKRSVNKYLNEKTNYKMEIDLESIHLRVTRELLSEEIHSLVRQYFQDDGLPPFIIKHEIQKANLPDLEWIKSEKKAMQ